MNGFYPSNRAKSGGARGECFDQGYIFMSAIHQVSGPQEQIDLIACICVGFPHKLRTKPGGGFVGRIEESLMGTVAFCGRLAPCDVHSGDDGQVRGHTPGNRADRGRRLGKSYSGGRRGRGSACLVRSFAHLPRSFLEERRKGLSAMIRDGRSLIAGVHLDRPKSTYAAREVMLSS